MMQIRHAYISVRKGQTRTFGGSQMYSASKTMREVGCGVIAALDLLLYLNRVHLGSRCEMFSAALEDGSIDEKEYDELARSLSRRFFPIIPKLGINGLMLAAGLNVFFRRYHFPFRASWGAGSRHLAERIADMLSRDIPVILSIGPNFPLFWQKNELNFYVQVSHGEMKRACSIKSHYVTVTGMDDTHFRISSWGREYYIDRQEYLSYIRHHSGSLVSNIVFIRSL